MYLWWPFQIPPERCLSAEATGGSKASVAASDPIWYRWDEVDNGTCLWDVIGGKCALDQADVVAHVAVDKVQPVATVYGTAN